MNTTASATRQELKRFIDVIPERSFGIVKNCLSYLAEPVFSIDESLVIEPADGDEIAMIEEGMMEYEKDPSAFTDWKTVKKELRLD
jgi:hypothetical protein